MNIGKRAFSVAAPVIPCSSDTCCLSRCVISFFKDIGAIDVLQLLIIINVAVTSVCIASVGDFVFITTVGD